MRIWTLELGMRNGICGNGIGNFALCLLYESFEATVKNAGLLLYLMRI